MLHHRISLHYNPSVRLGPRSGLAIAQSGAARIGTSLSGLPLYSFRRSPGGGLQAGVLVEHALEIMPRAVTTCHDGHLAIDYEMLGMGVLARWNAEAPGDEWPLGPPPPPPGSDIRRKTDIVRIGTTVRDLPLYCYRYISGGGLQLGIMAQDVLRIVPEAVATGDDGYLIVDYDMLGLGDLAACNAARLHSSTAE